MKFLLILNILTIYLLVSCVGLKCYESSNVETELSNLTIDECDPDYPEYCVTITVKNGAISYLKCGDEEFCTSRGCYFDLCTKPGTYEDYYPEFPNVKYTVFCCDTDLCNVVSSAKNFENFNTLFFFPVLVGLYSTLIC